MKISKRIKLFYIDPNSYQNLEIYDHQLLSSLANQSNYDIFLIGSVKFKNKNTPYKRRLIFRYSDKTGFAKLISYVKSQMKLLIYIAKERPSIIHFQWFKVYFLDWLFLLIIKLLYSEIKIVHTAHNVLPHDSGGKHFEIFRKLYSSVDSIIVHTDHSKIDICKEFRIRESKISVIPHGLLTIDVDSGCDVSRVDKIFKEIDNRKVIFLLIGKINKYKGIELLLESWREFSNDEQRHLIIAGSDKKSMTSSFVDYDNVSLMTGSLTDEEFVMLIRKSDVVLLPYLKISQSGVLLSVLNEKKPVIITPLNGLLEPFKLGDVGWIMNDISAKSLSDELSKITKEKATQVHSDTKLWSLIGKYYDWDNIANLTADVYSK